MQIFSKPAPTKPILAIAAVEDRFHFTPNADPPFFPKWRQDLPELTESEQTTLERLHHRFAAHRRQGTIAEGAVDSLLLNSQDIYTVFRVIKQIKQQIATTA